jgi:hypothetical protein
MTTLPTVDTSGTALSLMHHTHPHRSGSCGHDHTAHGGHQRHRTVSDANSNWLHVRSFSTHGHQSAAKGSSSTVSRSEIRLILTF